MSNSAVPRRTITLLVRPLEIFEEKIWTAPVLFKIAPAMAHHWVLKITDGTDGEPEPCFEIGIANESIFAQEWMPWNKLKGSFQWIERRIGYTNLSDEQIFHAAVVVQFCAIGAG